MIKRYAIDVERWGTSMESRLVECDTGKLMFYSDHLAALSSCAAGEWRYDVENAPKNGTQVLIAWRWLNNIQVDRLFWSEPDGFWTDGSGLRGCVMPDLVFAFAAINTPEVQG